MSEKMKNEDNDHARCGQPQPGSCESDPRGDHRDRSELEVQARHLATYAASVNWEPGDNTREWLLGLRDLIEHVQALTRPNPSEMASDRDLSDLDDEGCPMCGGTGELPHDCGEDTCCCLDKDGPICPQCGGMG